MAREPNDETPEQKRARYRHRASEVEMADPEQHPVDQAYKGTQWEKRFGRPIGLHALKQRRRAGMKLTEELIEDIACMLEDGIFQCHVEDLLGLSERCIANAIQRGKARANEIDDWDERAEGLDEFSASTELGHRPEVTMSMLLELRVRQSETIGETTLFGSLMNYALAGDTKAAMWLLERRYPQRYGRYSQRTDIPENDDGENAGADARAQLRALVDTMCTALET